MKITVMRYWEANDRELQEEIYVGDNPYEASYILCQSMIDDAYGSTIRYEVLNTPKP